jgi:hypothetical protein
VNEHIHRYVAELVLNIDKVGISDWEDRKTRRIVVQAIMDGETIHHAVSRNVKLI